MKTPSRFQKDIFNFIKNPKEGSLIIEAVAGSGKTTTICKALELLPDDSIITFLAFNKSIALELEERVPHHVDVMTMNSLGHRSWGKFVGGRVKLNANKTYDILTSEKFETAVDVDEFRMRRLRSKVRRLVGLAKQAGLVPAGFDPDAKGLVADTQEVWDAMIEHHDVEFLEAEDRIGMTDSEIRQQVGADKDDAIAMARVCLKMGLEKWNEIDFDDQLYMTVVYNAKVKQSEWLFVDEAQDISTIQRVLLRRGLKKNGRLVAVGDPRQAIYAWRGADSNALNNIKKEFNCKSLPLSISYRCPKAVVREAQKFVSHIESHESAPEGAVIDLGIYDKRKMEQFELGDFVVCRNNAPLVKLAFSLIRAKKPAKIMGREIGEGLIKLVDKLKAKSISDLVSKLDKWREKEIQRIIKKDADASTQLVDEKYDCLMVFIENAGSGIVADLCESIDSLFNGDEAEQTITLSTIHKAKGLEASRVLFLDSYLLPSKWAKKPWQKEQEVNLSYVAITRAKNTLAYIASPKKGEEMQ